MGEVSKHNKFGDGMRRLLPIPPVSSLEASNYLILDFDGVINAFNWSGTYPKEYYDARTRVSIQNPRYDGGVEDSTKTFTINYSRELVKDLNNFASSVPNLQILWLTTWREWVGEPVKRLELFPNFLQFYIPWGFTGESDFIPNDYQGYKIPVLASLLLSIGSGRRIVVVDDEICTEPGERILMDQLNSSGDEPYSYPLLVAPESEYGISRAQLSKIGEYYK